MREVLSVRSGDREMKTKSFLRIVVSIILVAVLIGGVTPTQTAYAATKKTQKKVTEQTYTPEELYEKISPACVQIKVTDYCGGEYIGSGFFIAKSKIVTNAHVIGAASKIEIIGLDDKKYTLTKLLKIDEDGQDIAVLKVKEKNSNYLKFSTKFSVGDKVYSVANPVGIKGLFYEGMVSNKLINVRDNRCIQIDMPSGIGVGGAPLCNTAGQVIGVLCYTVPSANNINMALYGEDVKAFINNITDADAVSLKKFYASNDGELVTPNAIDLFSDQSKENTAGAFAMSRLEMPIDELYEECVGAVVEVQTFVAMAGTIFPTGAGAGFFIDRTHVMTARHVIENTFMGNIIVYDYKGNAFSVTNIDLAEDGADIAKLELEILVPAQEGGDPYDHKTAVLNEYYIPAVGERVYALGHPQGYKYTLSSGLASMSSVTIDGIDYICHSAATSQGNSGGVLLNKYGEVIGVTNMLITTSEKTSLAVQIKHAP